MSVANADTNRIQLGGYSSCFAQLPPALRHPALLTHRLYCSQLRTFYFAVLIHVAVIRPFGSLTRRVCKQQIHLN